jgi:chemotaxis-related protein WspD
MQSNEVSYCWRRIGVHGDRSCARLKEHVHCRNCPVFSEAARDALERETQATTETASLSLYRQDRRAQQRRSLLAFKLGSEWLGIDSDVLVEVSSLRPTRRVAHRASGCIEGLVNVRGEIHLCVALDRLLNIEATAPAPGDVPRLVLVRSELDVWVFRASTVRGVVSFSSAQLRSPPIHAHEGGDVSSFLGMLEDGDHIISVLDTKKLFESFKHAVFA